MKNLLGCAQPSKNARAWEQETFEPWASGAQVDQLTRGSMFSLVGKNLYCSAELGDSIILKYSVDGEEKDIPVAPTFSSTELMNFSFPTELERNTA